jgi:hypothetical protein
MASGRERHPLLLISIQRGVIRSHWRGVRLRNLGVEQRRGGGAGELGSY